MLPNGSKKKLTMTDYNLRTEFAEVVGESWIGLAAADPDLVAFYELRMNGFTATVPLDRAELLENYDPNQLHAEIQRGYYLTPEEIPRVLAACIGHIAGVRVGFE